MNLCTDMKKPQSFIVPGSASCWLDDFDEFLRYQFGKSMPLEAAEFEEYVYKWATEDPKGRLAKSNKQAGFINQKLVFVEFEAKTDVNYQQPGSVKKPIFNQWEAFIAEQKAKAPA